MLPSRWPGVIKSYDKDSRECRVEIPGMTDGADVFPLATIEYPIGDKSKDVIHPTEIEIIAGDLVWLAFECGDPRFPIITGYRNPETGNSVDWRRWHHANIELNADGEILLTAQGRVHVVAPTVFVECTTATVNASDKIAMTAATSITFDSPETFVKHKLTVNGLLTWTQGMQGSGGTGAAISGNVNVTGGDVKVDGVGVKSHKHPEHDGPSTGVGTG